MSFADLQLTGHFRLSELTVTTNPGFVEKNRDVTLEQIDKLTNVARLLEHVRFLIGEPLIVHSGYRCPELNAAVGSSYRSQHLLCEAADFVPQFMPLEAAFTRIRDDIRDRATNVGQLIFETAERAYGPTSWLHISLGAPFRDAARCKQILRMENGKYTLLS